VAFHTFGGSDVFINPGSGRQQHYRILRELMKIRNFTGVSGKIPGSVKKTPRSTKNWKRQCIRAEIILTD